MNWVGKGSSGHVGQPGPAEDKLGLEKRRLRVAPRASGSCLNMATSILKTPALAA